jgi:hypothetical protein
LCKAIVLPGVTCGRSRVRAAAIAMRNPSLIRIYAGNPAKFIKKRTVLINNNETTFKHYDRYSHKNEAVFQAVLINWY